MESGEDKGCTNRKKIDWEQVGFQAQEKWSVQEQVGGIGAHPNAWCGLHRQFFRSGAQCDSEDGLDIVVGSGVRCGSDGCRNSLFRRRLERR